MVRVKEQMVFLCRHFEKLLPFARKEWAQTNELALKLATSLSFSLQFFASFGISPPTQ